MIVSEILKDIPDEDQLMYSHLKWLPALMIAINNALADEGLNVTRVSGMSTKKDLETAIRALPASIQVQLFYETILNSKNNKKIKSTGQFKEEEELHREERKFKMFRMRLIRLAIYTVSTFCFVFLMLAVYFSVSENKSPNTSIIKEILKTFIDLIKIIFSSSS